MKIIKKVEIVRGETISMKLLYREQVTGELIPIERCEVEYEILNYPSLESVKSKEIIDGDILLISHEVTALMEGRYIVRVYINDNGFRQIDDVSLNITK